MSDFLLKLRERNRARQIEWPNSDKIDMSYRAIAVGSEAGEVLGAVHKYLRLKNGIGGDKKDIQDIADEMGDVLITLDLLADMLGIDLAEAAAGKFDKTSVKYGLKTRFYQE